jgi:hypothetical protein
MGCQADCGTIGEITHQRRLQLSPVTIAIPAGWKETYAPPDAEGSSESHATGDGTGKSRLRVLVIDAGPADLFPDDAEILGQESVTLGDGESYAADRVILDGSQGLRLILTQDDLVIEVFASSGEPGCDGQVRALLGLVTPP